MAEAVSLSGLQDGVHAEAGHPLPEVLGIMASDPGSPAAQAEGRSLDVAGEPATAAVLAPGVAPAVAAGGGDPGSPAGPRCGQCAEGAGSEADHLQYAFGALPPGATSGCCARVGVGGARGGLCGSPRCHQEHSRQRFEESGEQAGAGFRGAAIMRLSRVQARPGRCVVSSAGGRHSGALRGVLRWLPSGAVAGRAAAGAGDARLIIIGARAVK